MFSGNPDTWDGEGPRRICSVAQRLSDISEWEHGEATSCWPRADRLAWRRWTVIMARIAATRGRPSGGPWTASASGPRTSGSRFRR